MSMFSVNLLRCPVAVLTSAQVVYLGHYGDSERQRVPREVPDLQEVPREGEGGRERAPCSSLGHHRRPGHLSPGLLPARKRHE